MILITAPIHPVFLEVLDTKGIVYRYVPDMTYLRLESEIVTCTGLVVSTHIPIDQNLMDRAHQLKWIARLGSGMEHIDVKYAEAKGIRCISSPEGNRRAVAEHAIGLLLNLVRNIHASQSGLLQHLWLRDQNRGIELEGKSAGVIGYGNTGSEMGKLLSAFGMNVLVYDKYRAVESIGTIKASSLNEIMEEANVISLHLPYTPETHHLVNDDFFRALKHSPVLINTSRGSIVNTSSLLHALDCGMISGAGLDVLENEKPDSFNVDERVVFDRLMQHAQVIITPHIAGYTQESPKKMARVILEKLGLEV